jgi:ubiquinone/menaquinone biosynthesis C-methylase UbiE
MTESHIFDPKKFAILESEDRKNWQNPEEIIPLLKLKPSYVVGDLGSGTGYFSVPISRRVKKVYSIDIQMEMLTYLEQKIQKQKIENIEPVVSKENEIPLPNECVDLLLTVNTLHEFHDKDAVITEMCRVLKADGQVAVVDFRKEDTGFGPPVSHRISKKEAIFLFKKNGLTALESHDFKFHYMLIFGKAGR